MTDNWRTNPRFWTTERVVILRDHYARGTHIDEIAAILDTTSIAAHSKAVRLKLPRRPSKRKRTTRPKSKVVRLTPKGFWTAERVTFLREGYRDGLHVEAISNLLGCTKNAVVGKAYRLSISHPNAGLGIAWAA